MSWKLPKSCIYLSVTLLIISKPVIIKNQWLHFILIPFPLTVLAFHVEDFFHLLLIKSNRGIDRLKSK